MLPYIHIILFLTFYLMTTAYAVGRGGAPERWAAAIMAGGALLTAILIGPAGHRFRGPEYGVAVADTLMLAAFTWLMLTADRFWPVWMAAIQGVTVLSHLAFILKPVPLPVYYQNTVNLWSYPQVGLLAVATLRHRLRGRESTAAERGFGRMGAAVAKAISREPGWARPQNH